MIWSCSRCSTDLTEAECARYESMCGPCKIKWEKQVTIWRGGQRNRELDRMFRARRARHFGAT